VKPSTKFGEHYLTKIP